MPIIAPPVSLRALALEAGWPRLQCTTRAYATQQASATGLLSVFVRHALTFDAQTSWTDIQAEWGGFRDTSTDTAVPITLAGVALEFGGRWRMSFPNGGYGAVVQPGALARTNPLSLIVPGGTACFLRYQFTVPSGNYTVAYGLPAGGLLGGINYDGVDYVMAGGLPAGSVSTDGGDIGLPFPPLTITGRPLSRRSTILNAPLVAVAFWGDSILGGQGDLNTLTNGARGFGSRAFETLGLGYTQLSRVGQTLQNFAPDFHAYRRRNGLRAVTHAITNLGTNDIQARTIAQMQADLATFASGNMAYGVRTIPTTLTPRTNAANDGGFFTGDDASIVTKRRTWNAWLRTNPLGWGVVDVARAAEATGNEDVWRTDLGSPSADGLHPNAVIHAAMATKLATDLPAVLR